MFRPGNWPLGNPANLAVRLSEVTRDLVGLLTIGRQYNMAAAFYNGVGDTVGAAVSDVQRIVEPLDPNLAGYYFDVANAAQAGGGWEAALRAALPRVKAVTVQDFTLDKDKKMIRCPLGQGSIDGPKFFQMLAQAGYLGPVTIHVGYPTRDMPGAFASDLQFARKQIQTAWGLGPRT